jgi:hypothetical protein
MWYRIRVNWTYTTVAQAQATDTALRAALTTAGRSEVPSRNNTVIDLMVEPVEASDVNALSTALVAAWNRNGRAGGKASIVMRDEGSQ